jgi:hypothetical protein
MLNFSDPRGCGCDFLAYLILVLGVMILVVLVLK